MKLKHKNNIENQYKTILSKVNNLSDCKLIDYLKKSRTKSTYDWITWQSIFDIIDFNTIKDTKETKLKSILNRDLLLNKIKESFKDKLKKTSSINYIKQINKKISSNNLKINESYSSCKITQNEYKSVKSSLFTNSVKKFNTNNAYISYIESSTKSNSLNNNKSICLNDNSSNVKKEETYLDSYKINNNSSLVKPFFCNFTSHKLNESDNKPVTDKKFNKSLTIDNIKNNIFDLKNNKLEYNDNSLNNYNILHFSNKFHYKTKYLNSKRKSKIENTITNNSNLETLNNTATFGDIINVNNDLNESNPSIYSIDNINTKLNKIINLNNGNNYNLKDNEIDNKSKIFNKLNLELPLNENRFVSKIKINNLMSSYNCKDFNYNIANTLGLKEISKKVATIIQSNKTTNYKDISNAIVNEIEIKSDNDEKNIRRRIYDALNVLKAINLFKYIDSRTILNCNKLFNNSEDTELSTVLQNIKTQIISNESKICIINDLHNRIDELKFYIHKNENLNKILKIKKKEIKLKKNKNSNNLYCKDYSVLINNVFNKENNKILKNIDYSYINNRIYFPFIIFVCPSKISLTSIVDDSAKRKCVIGNSIPFQIYGDFEIIKKVNNKS